SRIDSKIIVAHWALLIPGAKLRGSPKRVAIIGLGSCQKGYSIANGTKIVLKVVAAKWAKPGMKG
ncbi:MAG: hypothetical protein ACKN82_06275, partial [Pirellula sp.]